MDPPAVVQTTALVLLEDLQDSTGELQVVVPRLDQVISTHSWYSSVALDEENFSKRKSKVLGFVGQSQKYLSLQLPATPQTTTEADLVEKFRVST